MASNANKQEQEQKFIHSLDLQLNELKHVRDFLKNNPTKSIHSDPQFNSFLEKYPKLSKSLHSSSFDLDRLITYKETWKKIYIETPGEHEDKKYMADKNIGMELAKIYLFPQKGSPSYKQLKLANEKLKKKIKQPIEIKTKEEIKKNSILKQI